MNTITGEVRLLIKGRKAICVAAGVPRDRFEDHVRAGMPAAQLVKDGPWYAHPEELNKWVKQRVRDALQESRNKLWEKVK